MIFYSIMNAYKKKWTHIFLLGLLIQLVFLFLIITTNFNYNYNETAMIYNNNDYSFDYDFCLANSYADYNDPRLIEYPSDGNPIGGGYGYNDIIENYDYHVGTKNEFLEALENAQEHEIIYVADEAIIDLTGEKGIIVPKNVTIASGRGKTSQNLGGLIFKSEFMDANALFIAEEDVRISGLRIQGPGAFWAEFQENGVVSGSRGIGSYGGFIEIDNCELYNWSYAAIDINNAFGIIQTIHHNYIHDCAGPLGYGIEMGVASPLIQANIFSRCRHAIAGIGQQGCSYEACYNIVLESGYNWDGYPSHVFDMHGSYDYNKYIPPFLALAGSEIKIHHNTFSNPRSDGTNVYSQDNVADIVIRGKPRFTCEIYQNWFFDDNINHAVMQKYARGNMKVWNNRMGLDQSPQAEWDATFWPQQAISTATGIYFLIIGASMIMSLGFYIRKKRRK